MKTFYADLHIHIGCSGTGRPVKITASRNLTFENIIRECLTRKGLDLIGIVDCAAPGVLKDIQGLKEKGDLLELPQGGLLHKDRVTVLLGSEIETVEIDGGVSHQIAYFPFLQNIRDFSRLMSKYITNLELSSQRASLSAAELYAVVSALNGILIPAHAFTPYKSVYGNCADEFEMIYGEDWQEQIPAVELGLSADTDIADHLQELENLSFLSNSDAHSLPKIGREYNILEMEKANFKEFVLALLRRQGRKITANYGMDPKLGKYHRSYCHHCESVATAPPPVLSCPNCKHKEAEFVLGVFDRVVTIQDYPEPRHPAHRPPYHYQVPLEFVPGMKESLYQRLIDCFGSEMAVLHKATPLDLKKAVGWETSQDIILAREGKLLLSSGGGGHYGKVKGYASDNQQLELLS